jgi:lipopolysaccharide export system ATP-binding protein
MTKMHVDSVIKSFGSKQVLTDIFIACEKGEIIGLLGRNGSGKSTLLKVIFGSIMADSKFVRIGDKLIGGVFDNRELLKYLPQDGFLPSHVKVNRMIYLFCDRIAANEIRNHKLVQKWLDKKPPDLTTGQKRLLEVLLIIHSKAKYILIDEPFKGVAPLYREEIKKYIKQHAQEKGFIITDHDYRNILDVATKTVLIHDGGTRIIENKEELKLWGYIPETA